MKKHQIPCLPSLVWPEWVSNPCSNTLRGKQANHDTTDTVRSNIMFSNIFYIYISCSRMYVGFNPKHQDLAEILLKLVLNTNQSINPKYLPVLWMYPIKQPLLFSFLNRIHLPLWFVVINLMMATLRFWQSEQQASLYIQSYLEHNNFTQSSHIKLLDNTLFYLNKNLHVLRNLEIVNSKKIWMFEYQHGRWKSYLFQLSPEFGTKRLIIC